MKLKRNSVFLGYKGFTLAEVLITLSIIGVVASMTIPTLMQNIQDNEFKNKMRKEYSVLSEAYQLLAQENGGQFVYALSGCSDSGYKCFKDVFKQKLSYIKECDVNSGANLGVCYPAQANVKYLNGTPAGDTFIGNTYTASLVLKDGAALAMFLDSASCAASGAGFTNKCGWIAVDVNGLKEPNTWGRDIYVFFVYSDAIRALGAGADDCGIGSNNGRTCASKYLIGN